MSEHTDELLEQTRRRLQELESKQEDDEVDWGERIELDPGESFVGRWKGETEGRNKEGGTFIVYLFWDRDGKRRFMFQTARLGWEIRDLAPAVGDEIAVVRGADLPAQSGKNPTQRYAVRARPSSDPLPKTEKADESGAQLGADDEFPF
jgi:hypothetical protein